MTMMCGKRVIKIRYYLLHTLSGVESFTLHGPSTETTDDFVNIWRCVFLSHLPVVNLTHDL